MAKKRKAKKSKAKKRSVKKVKLTPDAAVLIEGPKDVAPAVIVDPKSGALHILPISVEKLKRRGWFERTFG